MNMSKETETKDVNTGEEIQDAEFAVLDAVNFPPDYTGEVISVHEGFSYLGNIKRGYESIVTNGDVFVPQVFSVGDMVKFSELNDDSKRSGKFRTEKAEKVEKAVVAAASADKAVALSSLTSKTSSLYHVNAKEIDPAKVKKALSNGPFAEMMALNHQLSKDPTQQDIREASSAFLTSIYANLISLGVDYSVDRDVDEAAEKKKIKEAIKYYRNSNMDGQVRSIEKEYQSFLGVRKVFSLMVEQGILSFETVIPVKYLPDLLSACPVWFVHSKEKLSYDLEKEDPKVDHATKFFCDLVGSREFAWFYQIYNRRTRPFSAFDGRDIMPLPIMKICEAAKSCFDYLVIATPYHDIASTEWTDSEWLRNIDPFLFGFVKDLPYMFLLGRWSGTGLFPLLGDMVADTMDHLRKNHHLLNNFRSNSYWYKGEGTRRLNNDKVVVVLDNSSRDNGDNEVLFPFVQKIIEAFEEGSLFQFLRGEKELITE